MSTTLLIPIEKLLVQNPGDSQKEHSRLSMGDRGESLCHAPTAHGCAREQCDMFIACRDPVPSGLSTASCSTCLLATWHVSATANKSPTTREVYADFAFSISHLQQPVSSSVSLIPPTCMTDFHNPISASTSPCFRSSILSSPNTTSTATL